VAAVSADFDVSIAFETKDDEEWRKGREEFLERVPGVHLFPIYEKEVFFPFWYRIASKVKSYVHRQKGIDTKGTYETEMYAWWINTVSPLKETWLNHVSAICSEHHFDIIQVEMPWMVSVVLTLPRESKRVFVHHELGFVRRELEISQYGSSQYAKACKEYADMAEIDLLNRYDAVVTLSVVDRQKLIEKGVTTPVYSSIATIVKSPQSVVPLFGDGHQLSFVGPELSSPNPAGLTWFLENCWKRLTDTDSGFRLRVIGSWTAERIEEYTSAYPNIEFLGFVDDLEAAIRGTVMIVPITIGSGIRMKILEACSLGVPFVSTSVGAEGIPVEDERDCYIADTPETFVDKLLKLRDQGIQRKLVESARKMVDTNYSQEALRKSRLDIYQRILQQQENCVRG